jgi:predicted glycosyltransferase
VAGRGGDGLDGEQIADAARTFSNVQWRAIGPVTPPRDCPSNLTLVGWTDRADLEIAEASVVVGAAGDGLVTAVLAAEKPFICIPQPRPFDEQSATATGLGRAQAAIVRSTWPLPTEWPELIDAAMRIDPERRRALSDPQGPQKLARWIEGLVGLDHPDVISA